MAVSVIGPGLPRHSYIVIYIEIRPNASYHHIMLLSDLLWLLYTLAVAILGRIHPHWA